MTLRIARVSSDQPGILYLQGRLAAEEVSELEQSAETGICALDLKDLLSVDQEGLAALRRLCARGIEIRNPSRYLAMLLA